MKPRTSDRPVFPFEIGEVVGYAGQRVTVSYINPRYRDRVQIRMPDGVTAFASITELTDPPPIPEHVQAAADEAVESGMFRDPRRAVFGGEGS